MNKFALACMTISLVCIADGVRAQPCLITMEGETKGLWQGPCPNGFASGTGTAILENATYHGAAEGGRAIGKGQLKLRDGAIHECQFGGWAIDCPDVELDVRSSPLVRQPAGGQAEGEAAAAGAMEEPPTDRLADDRRDNHAASSDGARDAANAGHVDPVQPTEPAASWDQSPSAGIEAPTPGPAAAAEPVSLRAPAQPCKLTFGGEVVDWSGGCENGWASGEGTARVPNGMTYKGSAARGRPHGFGTTDGPSGYYQGDFSNGLRHGKGIYRGADGKYYTARFENGFQATEGVPVQDPAPGEDKADHVREASARPDRDESGTDDAGYSAAVEALGKPDGVSGGTASDDSYEGKLAELERREKALEIEAKFREKEREKERRSAALKEELRKKAEAKEAERDRKHLQLGSKAAKSWNKQLGSTRSGTTLFGGSGGAQRAFQNTLDRMIQLNRQRQAERQRYEQQQRTIQRPRTGCKRTCVSRRTGRVECCGSIQ